MASLKQDKETEERALFEKIKNNKVYSVCRNAKDGLGEEDCKTLRKEALAILHYEDPSHEYQRTWAMLHYIESLYHRAFSEVENMSAKDRRKIHGKRYSPGYELDIDVYTKHWMWANEEMIEKCGLSGKIEDICGYKPEKNKYMKKGSSMYVIPQTK